MAPISRMAPLPVGYRLAAGLRIVQPGHLTTAAVIGGIAPAKVRYDQYVRFADPTAGHPARAEPCVPGRVIRHGWRCLTTTRRHPNGPSCGNTKLRIANSATTR
ncbi:hypothetical protein [Nocardia sp. CS682]|uniref:hypothetical protein n=1 Tax=Nocardia sp. CS682 TaxID=1047172 RepID=UPI003519DB5D